MKILITGVAGFIGSNLAQRCLDEGWETHGVDNLSNGHVEFLPNGTNFIYADFSDEKVLNKIRSQEFDVVFHLAAVPRVSYSVEHPLETNDVNVSRTLELIEACKGNVKRFVFASSSSVYGGADVIANGPTLETHSKDPKSPYALQKSIIEDYLTLYGQLYGLESICLRFFNVFGPNQLGDSPYATAVSAWISAILKGKPMRSDGDGMQSRDMCYVDNVTDACVRAAKKINYYGVTLALTTPMGRCYNVACGERTTNNQILQYLTKRYPQALVQLAPKRPGDVMHTHADISRASHELGYTPIVRVWEGIERTIKWAEKTPEFLTLKLNT
jgi:nucleoside-diphosphate-sugar epimerase